jgi:hypothetical protein
MAKDFEREVGRRDPLEQQRRADGSKTAVGITALIVITAVIIIVGALLILM